MKSRRARAEKAPAPCPDERLVSLRRELAEWASAGPAEVRVVRSPYRVCPLGAHVDHQLGEVTGMALDKALLVAFVARDDGRMSVRSRQFPGAAEFAVGDAVLAKAGDWADYARGAVFALRQGWPVRRGIAALVDGHDDVGGLSSSAAAGLGYLLALEEANGLALSPAQNIELDRVLENGYTGLDNGILDQAVILLSRPGQLTHVDCRSGRSRLIPLGGGKPFSVAVLFSGLRAPLYATDYNLRVAECGKAAARLLRAAGMPVPQRPHLRAVPPDVFELRGSALPEKLRRRAAHFFGEQERVRRGVELWRQGDLAAFGQLVSESGRSSVENYECGNPYLRTACEVLRQCPGVHGARFSGGGFRGCCIALAQPEAEQEIAQASLARYLGTHPDMQGQARVYFCRSAEGARLLD